MGTWIVGIVLIVIVALIIYKLVQDKRHGKSSCGSNCSGCANAQYCHSGTAKKETKKL